MDPRVIIIIIVIALAYKGGEEVVHGVKKAGHTIVHIIKKVK